MEKFVLSIARQFASMGRTIAQKTAERLGVEFYDRDIIEEAAKRTNLPLAQASEEEEAAARKLFPLGRGTTETQDRIFAAQESIIRDLADGPSCIIVGRCADHILRDDPHLLRVYIYAPLESRVRNCVEHLYMNERDARRMCAGVDRARENYYQRYAGYSIGDPMHRDLMLNSAAFGIDGTADFLAAAIRTRFGE